MLAADCFANPKDPALDVHGLPASHWPQFSQQLSPGLQAYAASQGFKAQAGRLLHLHGADGGLSRAVLGLGEHPSPLLFGAAAAHLPSGNYRLPPGPAGLDPTQSAIAWALGAYAFDRYKAKSRAGARLCPPAGADMAEALRVAQAVYLVRDLVNTPAGDMGPATLQAMAQSLADRFGARLEAVIGEDLLTQGYPLVHGVGRAASEPPRLLHLTWGKDPAAPQICLIGKGVTFDTGGLNMKTGAGMALMKKDMGGAAHALALAQLIMDANLPVRLSVLVPIAENSISAASVRPGDVLISRGGRSIEITNTDAEGRLILADALAKACEDAPDLLLDFATLTGAARVALGPDLVPFYTEEDNLAQALHKAALAVNDPLWRMPLWAAYDSDLDSPIADMRNSGDGQAGSILAALFLRRFVTIPNWAHFDIFAWSPKERPARPMGGDATGLRAAWHMLKARFAQ